MSPSYRIVSDDHSNHNLPIGALVTSPEAPEWASSDGDWYTLGGAGDEVAIDPRDLQEIVETVVTEVS